ncbi:helix-turn-helix domain-containing protein [Fictibacillus barbaricus]|uniref:Transcriptional regulator with XRE-family HTH domain n=1 Tax=Fictibacillus barbaricus TaxID=182136 RepID=A0ABU1U5E2_9BACL|nr:helix-turn-helix domain-containing protein [Fictibacillus barbaricus]MDR7074675.1 transcriptional regulator with XRE-family HTH domain [Fictibacillus barbaricus]
MRQEIGQRVCFLRKKKGFSLAEHAKEFGVSKTYMFNLEAGKSKSIYFQILEELQKELHIFPDVLPDKENDESSFRVNHAINRYKELLAKDEEAAEYLLSSFEKGLELLLSKSK